MTREFLLGDVIAEHPLVFESADGTSTDVHVRLGRPFKDSEHPETWACPYQISGLGSDKVRAIFGVDSMQALLLAVHTLPAELAFFVRTRAGRFTSLGEPDTTFLAGCRIAIGTAGDVLPDRDR